MTGYISSAYENNLARNAGIIQLIQDNTVEFYDFLLPNIFFRNPCDGLGDAGVLYDLIC